jgi:hypothetical protein
MAKKILLKPQSETPEKPETPKVTPVTVRCVRLRLEDTVKNLDALATLTNVIESIGGNQGNPIAGSFGGFLDHLRNVIGKQHEILGAVEEEFAAALQATS